MKNNKNQMKTVKVKKPTTEVSMKEYSSRAFAFSESGPSVNGFATLTEKDANRLADSCQAAVDNSVYGNIFTEAANTVQGLKGIVDDYIKGAESASELSKAKADILNAKVRVNGNIKQYIDARIIATYYQITNSLIGAIINTIDNDYPFLNLSKRIYDNQYVSGEFKFMITGIMNTAGYDIRRFVDACLGDDQYTNSTALDNAVNFATLPNVITSRVYMEVISWIYRVIFPLSEDFNPVTMNELVNSLNGSFILFHNSLAGLFDYAAEMAKALYTDDMREFLLADRKTNNRNCDCCDEYYDQYY